MTHGDLKARVMAQLGQTPLVARVVAERARVPFIVAAGVLRKAALAKECRSSDVVTNGRRKKRYWVDELP